MKLKYVGYLMIFFYLILIFVKNNTNISLDFIFIDFNVSLFLIFISSFILGGLFVFMFMHKRVVHFRKIAKGLKNEKKESDAK